MSLDASAMNLGMILVKLGLATPHEIAAAVEYQSTATDRDLLGQILVARGLVTPEQLERALTLQIGIRSNHRHARALAAAELARESSASILSMSQRVEEASASLRRESTGTGHPAIGTTDADALMLKELDE